MFLHLGGDVAVYIKDIIGILDMDTVLKSKDIKEFLKTCEEEGCVSRITNEKPRSFIIIEKKEPIGNRGHFINKTMVYYSPISALTLQKRANLVNYK